MQQGRVFERLIASKPACLDINLVLFMMGRLILIHLGVITGLGFCTEAPANILYTFSLLVFILFLSLSLLS